MCSLLCGGGLFYVDKVLELVEAICTKSLVHHQVVTFAVYYFLVSEPPIVDWGVVFVFSQEVDKQFFVGGLKCNSYLCQLYQYGGW